MILVTDIIFLANIDKILEFISQTYHFVRIDAVLFLSFPFLNERQSKKEFIDTNYDKTHKKPPYNKDAAEHYRNDSAPKPLAIHLE